MNIIGDISYGKLLSRSQFETIVEPETRKLRNFLQDAVDRLHSIGVEKESIDIIELVGDCTRTPVLQELVKTAFDKRDLKCTLNSRESLALGTAWMAANES